ncbi:MAG TPA: dihydrofolate reductase family protein [Spirochaetia bacterium]|nr:dihydrofolate reductase family protein [Spirochaetia bacterium]
MRRVFLFNMMTLDGFFAGPGGQITWHNVDREFNDFAVEQLKEIETLVFGRITYELMASYWPTPKAVKGDPIVAERMNNLPKVVFSRTLKKLEWNNSRLAAGDPATELTRLKKSEGRAIAILGSANLIASLLSSGLVDEVRVMVNPVLLGKGFPLFQNNDMRRLKLLSARTFASGNVLLRYELAQGLSSTSRTRVASSTGE